MKRNVLTGNHLIFELSVTFLDAISLIYFGAVCRVSYKLSNSHYLWRKLCTLLWESKVYVPCGFRSLLLQQNIPEAPYLTKALYFGSILDSNRDLLYTEEFFSFNWRFRFREAAGDEWMHFDPWHQGRPATMLQFKPDGSMHTQSTVVVPSVITDRSPDSTNSSVLNVEEESGGLIISRTWRKVDKCHGFAINKHITAIDKCRDEYHKKLSPSLYRLSSSKFAMAVKKVVGSGTGKRSAAAKYIRVTVNMLDVPTYVIRRSPTDNWGFIMESCWGIFSSWDMANKDVPQIPVDAPLNVDNSSSASVGVGTCSSVGKNHTLLGEEVLSLTTYIQRDEADLFNAGINNDTGNIL